jgi:hypothetical protein
MTYPFNPIQIIIRTNVVFCLPTIPDDILSRKRHLTPMTPQELPQLLTLIVRYNRLHLILEKNHAVNISSNFGCLFPEVMISERTCLISDATTLSTV